MDTFFTYLTQNKKIKIINYLNKEIDSLESLIDLQSNFTSDKMPHSS